MFEDDIPSEYGFEEEEETRRPVEISPPKAEGGAAWMVTFTDLVSLMLTFFVMLFSMASVQVDKWEEMIDALSSSLNPTKVETVPAATAKFNISTVFRKRAINLDYLEAVLEEKVATDPLLKNSLIQLLDDRLVISLPGDLLFGKGQAILSPKAKVAMMALGDVLRHVSNQVVINGHTDPIPMQGLDYASNWELSLARAIAIGNSLKRSGFSEDIVAYGFGDSRFSELPNVDLEQRYAMARRVDIMILQTSGN